MAQWMVKLAGNEFDLKTLSSLYTESDCRVAKGADGSYYLTRDAFTAMTEAAAVDGAVREWLAIANADMKLRDANYEPVSVNAVTRINDDGTQTHTHSISARVALIGTARLRVEGIVIGPDGVPVPSLEPARAQARLKLAERNERVREALDYSRRCNPGDADCLSYVYKISEIILEDMGNGKVAEGAKAVASRGWSTKDEMHDFEASVHSREISGRKARHAGARRVKAGVTPMSEVAVIECIRRVLRNWLDWKAERAI